jgi:endonuclease YncB( thermonuclease family)
VRGALLAVLLLASPGAAAQSEGRVVSVRDGDTLVVRGPSGVVRVRLWGIDCPELGQPFGKASRRFAAEACAGRDVGLDERGHDRYGRLLAVVRLPSGESLNAALVRAGLAWWSYAYSPKALDFAVLEQEARKEKRGLWADARAVPPWSWRKLKGRVGS